MCYVYTVVEKPHPQQCFIQRVGNLGFPTLRLKFPPQALLTSAIHLIVLLSHPQEHHVPYLTISKIMILYETLPRPYIIIFPAAPGKRNHVCDVACRVMLMCVGEAKITQVHSASIQYVTQQCWKTRVLDILQGDHYAVPLLKSWLSFSCGEWNHKFALTFDITLLFLCLRLSKKCHKGMYNSKQAVVLKFVIIFLLRKARDFMHQALPHFSVKHWKAYKNARVREYHLGLGVLSSGLVTYGQPHVILYNFVGHCLATKVL